jgi:hypothetical protein
MVLRPASGSLAVGTEPTRKALAKIAWVSVSS